MIKLLQLFSLILCPSQHGSYFYLVKIKPTLVSKQPSIYHKAPQTDSLFSPHTATPLLEVLLNSLLCLRTWTNHSPAPHNSDSQLNVGSIRKPIRTSAHDEWMGHEMRPNEWWRRIYTRERERDLETQTGRVGGVCQKWRSKKKVTRSFQVFLFCCLLLVVVVGVPSLGWFGNWKATNEANMWGWCESGKCNSWVRLIFRGRLYLRLGMSLFDIRVRLGTGEAALGARGKPFDATRVRQFMDHDFLRKTQEKQRFRSCRSWMWCSSL